MKHTILFVAANPRGTDQLALDKECKAIRAALRGAANRDDFDFQSRWAVGVDDLMDCLNDISPTVLHFSGHGTRSGTRPTTGAGLHRDVESPRGAGILLEERDNAQYVDHLALAEMVASVPPVPGLVVLNACYSSAVAESLRRIVNCVIGVEEAIEDTTAREFAVAFYRALGYRHSIGTAVDQARATLRGKQLPGEIVTCHPRQGLRAHELYLSPTGITPSSMGPRGTEPLHSTKEPISQLSHHASHNVGIVIETTSQMTGSSARTTIPEPPTPEICGTNPAPTAPASPAIGSGSWPSAPEPQAQNARDRNTGATRAVSQATGSGAWRAAAEPYDLFIAHPAANKSTASRLYDLLQSDLRVFFASRSLSSNDHWESAVSAAQRNSRATVLVISQRTDADWYLGNDIITGLALHRASAGAHRIVPVLLGAGITLPRCLGDVEAIVATASDLTSATAQLGALVATLPAIAAPWIAPVSDRRARCDHFQIYKRLCQITDPVFEQIVAKTGIDRGSVASHTAALIERALDVALLAALDPALCQRLSIELDRRAPGTR